MDKAPSSITQWADKKSGAFNRAPSQFRNWISKKPGAEFPPEKGRYHFYVSYACPWGESVPLLPQGTVRTELSTSSSDSDRSEVEGPGGYHPLHGRPLGNAGKRYAIVPVFAFMINP